MNRKRLNVFGDSLCSLSEGGVKADVFQDLEVECTINPFSEVSCCLQLHV